MLTTSDMMAASGVCFGTSGVRGLVTQLTDEVCFAYAQAFLHVLALAPGGRVALAVDRRPSSPRIAMACAAAIGESGLAVDYCGAIPTPALAYYAQEQGIPAVMVTGSHIPFDRNGIKFYRADGEISKANEAAIMAAAVPLSAAPAAVGLPAVNPAARQSYVRRYLDFFPGRPLAGMRLGFYEHSSVAREVLREILEALGAEVLSLGRSDGFVPIDTEAVAEADVRQAREWARLHALDALLSTDGDADRPLLGDEHGDWLRGDVVGILSARFLGARAVVTPVSSNTALERCGVFERVLRTRIGSPYVIAGMEALSAAGATAVVGFEANGGFLVGSPLVQTGRLLKSLPTRDAVLPILVLLVAARQRGIPVSRLCNGLPSRHTASARLQDFPAGRSGRLLDTLAASASARAELFGEWCGEMAGMDLTDGLRMTFASGEIVHLRPSGNAPELRCYAEADDPARAEFLARGCLDRLTAACPGN